MTCSCGRAPCDLSFCSQPPLSPLPPPLPLAVAWGQLLWADLLQAYGNGIGSYAVDTHWDRLLWCSVAPIMPLFGAPLQLGQWLGVNASGLQLVGHSPWGTLCFLDQYVAVGPYMNC